MLNCPLPICPDLDYFRKISHHYLQSGVPLATIRGLGKIGNLFLLSREVQPVTRQHDLPSLRHRGTFAVALVICLSAIQTASAVPILEVQLENVPDVFAQAILVSYDAAGNVLTATGTAVQYDDDGVGPAEPISTARFS